MTLTIGKNAIWRQMFLLLFGQLLSICSAAASFASSSIAEMGVDLPLTQSIAVYLPLAVVYGGIVMYRREKLQVPWYYYAVVAVADVQGNYLSTMAYQYTSITSVTLLYCWVIPWVMILSCFVIQTSYDLWQLLGAAICVVGLVLAVLSDAGISNEGGRNPVLGDTLVIAGTFGFALSNIGMEFCAKKKDLVEVLSMLGVFGVLVLLCEISIIERKDLESLKLSPKLMTLFVGYATAAFITTTMVVALIKMSGATLMNLSLLTTNMWAALIRFFVYNKQVNWLYCLAFTFAAIGLIIYSLNDASTSTSETTMEDLEATIPDYESLTEENSTCQDKDLIDCKDMQNSS